MTSSVNLISSVPSNSKEEYYEGIVGACRSVSVFEKLNRIGEGTYGIVYRARDKRNGNIYALKKVLLTNERDGLPITALREIRLLKAIDHPNIVKLYEVVVGKESDSIFLVFEYMEHDLAGLIDNMRTPFSESEVKCLMIQLLNAVASLHSKWIIHRDLKLSNLLFNNRGQLKIADFGLARLFSSPPQQYTPRVVTLWYRCPELLLNIDEYSTALDMWSVGCIFGELLLNEPVFRGKTEMDQLNQIIMLLGSPNERIWPGFSKLPLAKSVSLSQPYNNLRQKFSRLSEQGLDLLNRLLTYDPRKRISASDTLRHPYFTERPLPKEPSMMPTFPTRFDEKTMSDQGYKGKRKYEGSIGRPRGNIEERHLEKFNANIFHKSSSSLQRSSHLERIVPPSDSAEYRRFKYS